MIKLDLPWLQLAPVLTEVHDDHIHIKHFLDRYRVHERDGWNMWNKRVAHRVAQALMQQCPTEAAAIKRFHTSPRGMVHYGHVVTVFKELLPGTTDRQVRIHSLLLNCYVVDKLFLTPFCWA